MKERIQQLLDFLKESPEDPFLKYALTTEYVKTKELELARQGFTDLVENHPDYVGTYYHFGKFLIDNNELETALHIYQKGMEVARTKRNMHALGELQSAYNFALGEEEEEY